MAEFVEAEPVLESVGWSGEEGERGIEAASLPALAGEEGAAAAPEPAEAAPESLPTAESEVGVPLPEARELEIVPAEPVEPSPAPSYPVTTITERSEKPRKGWWRRLAP
jgi:hypothetical protein